MATANSNLLYHVTAHGVTVDILDDWNAAFSYMQECIQRMGSNNVKLLTIRDRRTPEQKHPAAVAKAGRNQA